MRLHAWISDYRTDCWCDWTPLHYCLHTSRVEALYGNKIKQNKILWNRHKSLYNFDANAIYLIRCWSIFMFFMKFLNVIKFFFSSLCIIFFLSQLLETDLPILLKDSITDRQREKSELDRKNIVWLISTKIRNLSKAEVMLLVFE